MSNIFGLYIFCVLVFDDSPSLYVLSNIVFIICFLLVIIKKKINIERNSFVLFLFAYAIWTVLSLIWAYDYSAVVSDIIKIVQFCMLIYMISICHTIGVNKKTLYFWSQLAGVSIFLYLMISIGPQAYLTSIYNGTRIGDGLLQLNKLGFNCALIALIALNLFLQEKKIIYLLSLLLMVFIMLGAESRRSFVVLFLGVIFVLFLKIREYTFSLRKIMAFLLFLVVIFLLIKMVLTLPIFNSIVKRFALLTEESNNSLRSLYIKYAWKSFIEHPILGIGSGNSHFITMAAAGKTTYIHNNYLEILANLGIIGFVFYYGMYIVLLVKLVKLNNHNLDRNIALTLLIAQLVSDMAITSYSSKMSYLIVGLAYGVILKEKYKGACKCNY